MKHKIMIRVVVDFLIVFAVFQGWWFVALPIALIFAWFSPLYVEIFCAGILYDALFGFVPDMGVKGYLGTIAGIIVFLVVLAFKKVVRR